MVNRIYCINSIVFLFNWSLKNRNQGLEEIKQYQIHIELIINVDNIAKRRLLAQFFAHVTASDNLRAGRKHYYTLVNEEYQDYFDSLETAMKKVEPLLRKIKLRGRN